MADKSPTTKQRAAAAAAAAEDVEAQTISHNDDNNNQAAPGEATNDSSKSKVQTKQTAVLLAKDPTLTTTTMGEKSQGIQTATRTTTPKNHTILMEHEDLPMLAIGSCELLNPWEPAVDWLTALFRGSGVFVFILLFSIVAWVWLLLTPLWLAIALSRILQNRKRRREHERKLDDLKDPTNQDYLKRFADLANGKKGYIVFGKQQQQQPNKGGGGRLVTGVMLRKDQIPGAGGAIVQTVDHNTRPPKSSRIAIARHGCWIDKAAPIAQFRSTHCRVALCTTATTTAGERSSSSTTSTTTKQGNQGVLMEKDLPVEWLVSHAASSGVNSLLHVMTTTTVSNGDDDFVDQMKIGQWYWFEVQPQKVGEIAIS